MENMTDSNGNAKAVFKKAYPTSTKTNAFMPIPVKRTGQGKLPSSFSDAVRIKEWSTAIDLELNELTEIKHGIMCCGGRR